MARPTGSVHSLLVERAARTPDRVAYVYLRDHGEREELTFGGLLRRARSLAGVLREAGAKGRPVLLPLEHPPDYAVGFFACLLAGALPASAAAPQRLRLAAAAEQLDAIAADCGATLAVGSERTIAMLAGQSGHLPALAAVRWIDVTESGDERNPTPGDCEALAYLQYTSGSTDRPKAVALAHRSLLGNLESQRRALSLSAATTMVSWLPLSHDMGFVAPVLQPVSLGCRTIFLAPASFLLKPLRWLQAIDAHRGTLSAAPNFAYDLTVRRTSAEDRAALDLSSWTHAVNGSEPVRAETLARFSEAFAIAGFRSEAFAPSYGMAEVTCMATCAARSRPVRVRRLDRAHLGDGRAVEVGAGDCDGEDHVSCGGPAPGIEVAIVDPEGQRSLPEGAVGEVWLSGASVGRGYFRRPAETADTFGVRLPGAGKAAFLRTGDLGFMLDGELYVVGRLRDQVVIRGRNYLPQEIETTAASSHPRLSPGAAAAFVVDAPDVQGLAVVVEVADVRGVDCAEIVAEVKAAVSRRHGLRPCLVALLGAGGLPKTASGKVRRPACRAALEEGSLERVLSITPGGEQFEPSTV